VLQLHTCNPLLVGTNINVVVMLSFMVLMTFSPLVAGSVSG
jgi:hypothetical protein